MKLRINKILSIIVVFLLSILTICSSVCPITVRADDSSHFSSVLADLNKDESFNLQDYPVMTLDYINNINSDLDSTNDQPLMEVISIGEGVDDNFYIYVYQPTDSEIDLIATSLLMSLDNSPDGQNLNLDIYDLELVSTSSVFDKYLVKDFTILSDVYRYYNIVTLYRNFDSRIDEVVSGGESEGAEIGIEVGQQWCVYYQNESIVYEMGTFETVDISITFTGHFSFSNGFTLGNLVGTFKEGHVWFVTFNVEDYIVKKIYDADLMYKIRSVEESYIGFLGPDYTYGAFSEKKVTLTETDKGSFNGAGLFSKDYSWNKISSSKNLLSSFLSQGLKIDDAATSALQNSQWAFCFLETELSLKYIGSSNKYYYYSDIEDVTIIRLHFLDIHNNVYNLGVVSDRVNPDNKQDNLTTYEQILAILKLILSLFLFIFLVWLLSATGILRLVFKIIVWVFTAPFKFIKWLIDKFRGK